MKHSDSVHRLSEMFSSIYFYCHPKFEIELSHQAVRLMQFIAMTGPATIHSLSGHLNVAHNTASEIVRRLQAKNLVVKQRKRDDERVVEVTLTEEGNKTLLQHTGLDIVLLAEALGEMSEGDRADVHNAFATLLQAVRGTSDDSVGN